MLEEGKLDRESRHERSKRDEEADSYEAVFVGDPLTSAMEMRPMLGALAPGPDDLVFELGCGTGRYTLHLTGACRAVIAVDFSGASLRILAERLEPGAGVGLVQADVASLRLARGAFDKGLSTLVSNLPGDAHRSAMYRLAAHALKPSGKFVFGTHNYRLQDRLRGVAREGHYGEGGIYRRCFERKEIAEEARAHFRRVTARAVQIPIPLGRRLGLPVPAISEVLGRLPLLNQLGQLLLVAADGPLSPANGDRAGPLHARAHVPDLPLLGGRETVAR